MEADRAAVTRLEGMPENFRVGLDLTDSGPVPTTERGYHPAALDALLDETPFHRLCTDFPADPATRLPVGHPAWPGAQPRRRGYLDRRPGDR